MSSTRIRLRSSKLSKLHWSDLTFVSPGLSVWPWGGFFSELSSIDFGVKMDYWPLFDFALLASCASIFVHRNGTYYLGFKKDSYFSIRECPYVSLVDGGSVSEDMFSSSIDNPRSEVFYDMFVPLDKLFIWCLSNGRLLSPEVGFEE